MLDFYGIDSTQYGVCHSDELYMFWEPYAAESYVLNEVRTHDWFIQALKYHFYRMTKL